LSFMICSLKSMPKTRPEINSPELLIVTGMPFICASKPLSPLLLLISKPIQQDGSPVFLTIISNSVNFSVVSQSDYAFEHIVNFICLTDQVNTGWSVALPLRSKSQFHACRARLYSVVWYLLCFPPRLIASRDPSALIIAPMNELVGEICECFKIA